MRSRVAVFFAFAFAVLFALGLFGSDEKAPKQPVNKQQSARVVGALPVSDGPTAKEQIAEDEIRGARYLADQIVVSFKEGATADQRRRAVDKVEGRIVDTINSTEAELVELPVGANVRQVRKTLAGASGVAFAEPNFVTQATDVPNDPLFAHQWGLNNTGQEIFASLTGQGLQNIRLRDGESGETISSFAGNADADIDAPEAWGTETGSQDVTVAVVDTGIDYDHPDLANRIWTNEGETGEGRENNGVDDDSDGLVDDWRGWDFHAPGGGIGDNDPFDDNLHGTHVSGTIAAAGDDGVGVTGVSWNSKIMPLKVLNENGAGNTFDSAKALAYAATHGADVVNGSYGSLAPSAVEREAIEQSPDTLFVFAAGNNSANLAAAAGYPCEYPQENIVCVAATDDKDRLASFSNYGPETVDLGAPGVNILSDKSSAVQNVSGDYLFLSGTSMASPHVAGAAALLKSYKPDESALSIKQALLESVDPLAVLDGKTSSGGRLNVSSALDAISGATPADASVSAPSWSRSMIYRAGNGTSEDLVVSEESGAIVFDSGGPEIDAGAGCESTSPSVVSCDKAGFTGIDIHTYDLADQVTIDVDIDAFIDTGDGNDSVLGGDGDDTILASAGDDNISGRGGDDAVSYGMRTTAVSVSADGQPGDGQVGESDDVDADIEIIRGGKGNDVLVSSSNGKELTGNAGDDQLLGGPGSEVISGRSGIDTLSGGDGDDRLLGGEDSDTINGGSGSDTADYSESYDGVDLSLDNERNDGMQGEDDFIGNDVENLVGSWSADVLTGNSSDNRLDGGTYDDYLIGGGGKDTFIGGETFPSHEWDIDTVSYETTTTAVSVTQDGIANDGNISIDEQDNVHSDVEAIVGGKGNDILQGGDDQNLLVGGPGDDVFSGGNGEDIVSYGDQIAPVTASRDGQANDGPAGQTDSIDDDIEGIWGGGGNDQLSVSGTTDSILIGGEGDDQLFGGAGDDLFSMEDGNDSVHGGDGDDLFMPECYDVEQWCMPSFWGWGWSLRISLDNQPGDGRPTESDNFHDDVEGIFGSPGDDVLVGSEGSDLIAGFGGSDRVIGKSGNDLLCGDNSCDDRYPYIGFSWFPDWDDTIDAGPGDDEVFADVGNDKVIAGDGDDFVQSGWDAPSTYFPDDDVVFGLGGNDSVRGGAGSDDLNGGSGGDDILGGVGADSVTINDLEADEADCGGDLDSATVDDGDSVVDCESATVESPVSTPSPHIVSPATGLWTSIASVPVIWTSTGEVVSHTCSIDGGPSSPCSSGVEVSGNGWHTIVVTATDSHGNSGSDSRSFGIDAGPIDYQWFTTGNTAKRQPVLGATASSASGIASIECSVDDQGLTESIPCTGGVVWPSELSLGVHQYRIRITNNVGAIAETTSHFQVVASPPSFQIASPNQGQVFLVGSTTVKWTKAIATKTTTCSVDGSPFQSCGTQLNVSGPGFHQVDVKQVDDAGGVGTASVSFAMDSIPNVTITSPTGTVGDATPTLGFSASAHTGIERTECHIPGSSGDYIPCTSGMEWPYALSDGDQTLKVRAYSNAGTSKVQTKLFTVLAVQPDVTIESPESGEVIANTTVDVVFGTTNWPTSVMCALDSGSASACSSPQSFAGLSQGDHTVQVTVTNAAGSETKAISFAVDTATPETEIDSGPADESTTDDQTPTFGFSGNPSSDTAGFDCRVDEGDWTSCGSGEDGSITLDALPNGSHTFEVRARDDVDNIDESPASRTFTVDAAGVLSMGSAVALPVGTPINLTDAGPDGWAHWGTLNVAESILLAPVRMSGAEELVGAATRLGSLATLRATSGIPQSVWSDSYPYGSPTTTAITTGGSTSSGFSFPIAAPFAHARTADLYLGARNTTGKLVVSISDDSASTITETALITAGSTIESIRVPITFRSVSPDAAVTVQYMQNTTGSTGRVFLESVALTDSEDHAPPTLMIESPSSGATTGPVVDVDFSAEDAASGVAEISCAIDEGDPSQCSSPFTTSSLAPGSHSVTVRARDGAGNLAITAVSFTVMPPPTVTIESPELDQRIASTTIVVAFNATDSPSSVTCEIDSAPATACTSPHEFLGLSQGNHTILVSATNASGAGSESITFVVDTVAPDTEIDSGPADESTTDDQTPTFGFSGNPSSDTAGFDCRVDEGDWTSCGGGEDGSITLDALPNGSHTFEVRAHDDLGNLDESPASRTFTVDAAGVLSMGSAVSLPAGAPINLTDAGPDGWAHWGTLNVAESILLIPQRMVGAEELVSAATRLGGQATLRATSGIPQSVWSGFPSGSPTTTAIATGGSTSSGFSFPIAAPFAHARTADLYLGARNTTGKLVVSISDDSASTITETALITAGSTIESIRVPITFRSVSPDAAVTVQYMQNTTGSTGRVFLESVALTDEAP